MSSSTPKKKSSSSSTSTTPSNTPSKKTTTGGAPLPPSPAVKARREKAPAAPAASSGSNEVSDDNNNANDNASHEDVQQTFLVLLGEHKYKFAAKASSYDELKKQLAAAYSVGYQFDLQYYDSEVAEYLDFSDLADLPQANVVKLLVKKLDVVDAPKLSLADIQNDRENELVIARDDFAEEEMRLFLHATNFRRMRKEASSQEHCPVISMVGPTGAGKSSLIKRLNPIKPPVVAFQEQQIPTTSNVNSFLSAGFDGLGKIRILDLEGDDGGLPLMEYCKNYQHLSATDYLSADDVSTFVKQVFQHYDEKELTAYMNKRKHVTKHLLPRLCVPEDDHQILTNRGFLFLDEVEALVAIDAATGDVSDWRGLRVANYDAAQQCIVYETPLALVRNDHSRAPTELVEFSDADEATRWSGQADINNKPAPRNARRLSVVTTAGHQMYARGSADASFAKIKAADASDKLARGDWRQVEFLAHAVNGVATASNAAPPMALLELYGAWLARCDGTVCEDGALCVRAASPADEQFVMERAVALGWSVERCGDGSLRVLCGDDASRVWFRADEWLWTLPRDAARAVVDAMCGDAAADVVTSSEAVRELCVRLGMHAGRAVQFDAGDAPSTWRVSFDDACDMTTAADELVVRKRLFGGRTWCFDMDDGFIVTRRALRVAAPAVVEPATKRRCGAAGVGGVAPRWSVATASRPTIQGNCYIMSDVIVYVNTVPAKRESMYLDRVLEFVEKSQTGVSSAEMPSLILVYNQCPKRQKPFDIAEATDHFFVFVDREKKLLESYRTVDFVKIPDWENESLYAQQVTALQKTIAQRVREQHELKRKNGTLFNDQVWFDILDKVVENFLLEANISMSRIFGKFIISESSLVNRAYAFFHHVYGSSTKKEFFVQAREQAIKMIAAHVVFRAIEKGHGELREIDDNWLKLYYNLLQRIRRRTPCLAMSGNVQCSEEMQTHAEQHRFGGTKKRSGVHQFTDPQSDKELEQVFRDTITMFQQLAAKGGPAAVASVHKARLKVFQDAISTHSTAPQKQCALCFKNRSDCLLSCEHAFCTQCMDGLKNSATAELACPLCTKDVHIIENVPKLPGRYGVRILCLEGGGVRGPVSLKSLRRLEHVTGMQIGDMFDIVCGTGVGGVVAATVGSGKLSLDQCEELFHSLSESVFQKPRMGHRVFNVGFLQSIFGKPYSAASFEQVLQTHLGDGSFLDGERRGEPRSPKVFALAGATAPHFEPYILGNYPPGKRDKPAVSCLYKLWEVCRATMSTPKFFAPFDKSGTLLVDGAVFANNPAEIAIAEANIIWNFPDIDLVVSVGCGLTGAHGGDEDGAGAGGDEEDGEAASAEGGSSRGDDDDNAASDGGKLKKNSSGSSTASKKAAAKAAAKAAKAAAKAPKGPKGDCKFTFGQEVVDLAETGESVHNNMRQVLKENEKYVRLEPTLSKPSAASTDSKQLRQMAAEAEAWVNDNDAKFLVARQRLLAKGLYVDGTGAFRCVVGETASFEIRRKRGLAPSVDIPIVVDLCNDANEPVPTTITPLEGVPGARRVTFKVPLRGVYTCNVQAVPAPPTAPTSVDKETLAEPIDVSGSPFLIQAELSSGAPPLPSSIEFIDFIKGMPLSVFRGASDETSGAHQQRLDARLKTLGLKVTPVPLDADCQFYAVAEQLFRRGAEQAPFIRSMATWWLRLNGDYILANGTRLDEQVPEGTWDSYVDQIEDGGWGDHVTLIAIAEVFGTSVRIVSSVEGDSFVTEIQPRVLKRTRVVLLSHWLEFAYGALKATSKSRLKN